MAPPVDTAARLRAELHPLLDQIAAVQARADAIRTEAETKTAAVLDGAQRDADQRVREAERQTAVARADAAAERHGSAEKEIAAILARGREEAQRIAAQSEERLPELIGAVRTCVLERLDASA